MLELDNYSLTALYQIKLHGSMTIFCLFNLVPSLLVKWTKHDEGEETFYLGADYVWTRQGF